MTWMLVKSAIIWSAAWEENDPMKKQQKQLTKLPKFKSEDEEAKWWASAEGRAFVKQHSSAGTPGKQKGSPLVANLSQTSSVQIALRLPVPDLAKAREIADRKGIGYQTLLKMILHEGLQREARRQ
jgi:hypothetical protein